MVLYKYRTGDERFQDEIFLLNKKMFLKEFGVSNLKQLEKQTYH